MRLFWIVPLSFLVACHTAKSTPDAGRTAVAAAEAHDEGPPKDTPSREILRRRSLADAIAFDRSYMTDSDDGELSPGALLLGLWSARNLQWSVLEELGRTRFAEVQKDPDAHRGQRICTRGRIIQIQAMHTPAGKLFTGLMFDYRGDLTSFLAVHSTGDLVERSRGRFCGVVIGKYDYPNSGGGEGQAIQLVGMFNLPENRH